MKKLIIKAPLLVVLAACQNNPTKEVEAMPKAENSISAASVIEITSFQLNSSATAQQLRNAASNMNETFLAQQSGFIHRTLTQKNDSVFTDVVFWVDEASADAAMKAAEKNADAGTFMQLINMQTIELNLHKSITAYGK